MPVLLVVAVAGGVAYAAFSTNVSRPPVATASAPPLDPAPGDSADPDETEEPDEPETPGADTPASPDEALTAVVHDHKDVGQYTYLHMVGDAGETWAAVYRAPIQDGKLVTVLHAARLSNFHSRELNRDFETIYFGVLAGYETAPAGSDAPLAAEGATAAVAPVSVKAIAGAMTIADLAKRAGSLVGKEVTVVGRVAKENDGILDRNWIHVVDGTGNAKDGTNDLLVTTASTSTVGNDVVARGTVNTNQDFGSGYAYKFLLEKATVTPATK
jgi:hypothetical protein